MSPPASRTGLMKTAAQNSPPSLRRQSTSVPVLNEPSNSALIRVSVLASEPFARRKLKLLPSPAIHSGAPEQRRPCPRDCSDLAGLSGGGRASALDSPAGQHHRTGSRVCGGLGDDPRCEMDLRSLVTF